MLRMQLALWWRRRRDARQRRRDIKYFWPAMKVDYSGNIRMAHQAFLRHANSSPAWLVLDEQTRRDLVKGLR